MDIGKETFTYSEMYVALSKNFHLSYVFEKFYEISGKKLSLDKESKISERLEF